MKQLAKEPIRTPCIVIPRINRSILCLEFNNGVLKLFLLLLTLPSTVAEAEGVGDGVDWDDKRDDIGGIGKVEELVVTYAP